MDDTTNLTEQESDDLLRAEIFAEEDSNSESGINDSQEQVTEATEEVETEEAENAEEESQEAQAEEKPKKKSNVPKILAEKNEWKRKALEAKAEADELRGKLWQDSDTDVSFFESKMKQMLAENNEKCHSSRNTLMLML